MAGLVQQGALESGAQFTAYTSVASDTDLSTAYPGYTAGAKKPKLPRLIIYTGGALVVEDTQGNSVTLAAAGAGIPLPIAPQKLISSGTAATFILVVW